jgi:hypothetical protein
MYDLSVKLQKIDETGSDNNYLRKKAIIETKKSLISMCFVKANEYLSATDRECANVYQTLYNYVLRLFEKSLGLETVRTVEVEI